MHHHPSALLKLLMLETTNQLRTDDSWLPTHSLFSFFLFFFLIQSSLWDFRSNGFHVHTEFILVHSLSVCFMMFGWNNGTADRQRAVRCCVLCNHLTSTSPTCSKVRHSLLNMVLPWFILFFLFFCFYCKFCSFCRVVVYGFNKYIWMLHFGLWPWSRVACVCKTKKCFISLSVDESVKQNRFLVWDLCNTLNSLSKSRI